VASIRDGDRGAFEALYDRLSVELLAFCTYMLGSRADAEDALQSTYTSAYRALLGDNRPVTLRPWMFTIARNECVSSLRRRRPTVELNGEPSLTGDPVRLAEIGEELREMLAGVRGLPEEQRAALVLAEVHGLSQGEIAGVLGVRPEQVKAYVYQARSNLVSEKRAREADCHEIREELGVARGAALLRGRLRRHVRSCASCRAYIDGVAHQHRQLGALLPIAPALAVKYQALEEVLGVAASDPASYAGSAAVGASVAGAAAEVAGGGIKAIGAKVAAGVVAVAASAGVGVSVLSVESAPRGRSASRVAAGSTRLTADRLANGAGGAGVTGSGQPQETGGRTRAGHHGPAGPRRTPDRAPSRSDTGLAREPGGGEVQGSSRAHEGSGAVQRAGSGGDAPDSEAVREAEAARAQLQQGHQQRQEQAALRREVREREQSEPQPEHEGRPLKSKEERHREREEHKPEGASRAPKSQEERELKREERRAARQGRQHEGEGSGP
jgi:RNA polymerase sigma factor (sigma-70 family)